MIVEPPSPHHNLRNSLHPQRNEYRRHSSHSPSLTVREFDKEKDRRYSGYNSNQLNIDPERMRFLSCSPAATRRISCGSLFKVSSLSDVFYQTYFTVFYYVKVMYKMFTLNSSLFKFFQPNDVMPLGSSRSSIFAGSTLGFFGLDRDRSDSDKEEKSKRDDKERKKDQTKKLPIINPLVRLPAWPSKEILEFHFEI